MTVDATERDLNLKLRVMRYLWHLGYFVRRNVDLVSYGYEKGRQYTDIDVLGIKIDEKLDSNFVACDCKSGTKVKTPERLFWLSGVMKYFDSPKGLFVRTQIISSKYIDLSSKLKITLLSSNEITGLEKAYKIDPNHYLGPFCAEQSAADNVFSELKKKNRKVHDYVLKGYWKDLPQQQIVSLIACCQKIKEMGKFEDYQQSFVLAYTISLLSLSILQFSRQILAIPFSEKDELIKQKLLGGNLTIEERKRILEGFYDFMAREIEERYNEKYPISKSAFLDSLLPRYTKYFVDLVVRICQDPQSAIISPRIFDLFAYETALNNRIFRLTDALSGMAFEKFSIKPTKDFFTFAERSDLVTDDLRSAFHEVLKSIEPER